MMVDWTIKRPIVVVHDNLVKVESLILPTYFVILDCEVDFEVSIVLGKAFLVTGSVVVDIEKGITMKRRHLIIVGP